MPTPARLRVIFRVVLFLTALALVQSGCQSLPVPSAEKSTIRGVLRAYREALNNRSVEGLFAIMSDRIQIDGMTDELSRAGLKAGMHWPPSRITDIQIYSMTRQPGGTRAKVAFSLSGAALFMQIGFDEQQRIRTIDPLVVWENPGARISKAFSSPFKESNGLMFVRAKVNGQNGFFLLDTGSSGLLLNTRYFSSDFPKELPGLVTTVHGIKPHLGRAGVRDFQWGEIQANGIRGQLHDFSNMENSSISPLLGAIGYEQLKNCAVFFDWKNRSVEVRPSGKGPARSAGKTLRPPQAVVGFTYFLHAPAFAVKIGGKSIPMLFDSGAQINLIPSLNGVEKNFHELESQTRISDGGQIGKESAQLGVIDETLIGGIRYQSLPFAVYGVPYLSGQGIIGNPILEKGAVELDFVKKTISIW
ncbi:MAG: aspartyl protease family protein [Terrimicrobiaceae bacterium]